MKRLVNTQKLSMNKKIAIRVQSVWDMPTRLQWAVILVNKLQFLCQWKWFIPEWNCNRPVKEELGVNQKGTHGKKIVRPSEILSLTMLEKQVMESYPETKRKRRKNNGITNDTRKIMLMIMLMIHADDNADDNADDTCWYMLMAHADDTCLWYMQVQILPWNLAW